jgi:hypothetical protein
MHTQELHVTIQLDHELAGVRARVILRDDDHSVTGVGWLAHQRTDPFPAREDLAVVRALRDLADRLIDRGRQAHPCAPSGNGRARAAAAGGRLPAAMAHLSHRGIRRSQTGLQGRAAAAGNGGG